MRFKLVSLLSNEYFTSLLVPRSWNINKICGTKMMSFLLAILPKCVYTKDKQFFISHWDKEIYLDFLGAKVNARLHHTRILTPPKVRHSLTFQPLLFINALIPCRQVDNPFVINPPPIISFGWVCLVFSMADLVSSSKVYHYIERATLRKIGD